MMLNLLINWRIYRLGLSQYDLQEILHPLNYLRVPFPHKRMTRITNLLERFFREFRSRADEIDCFGSPAQAETLFYLILQRGKAKHAVA